MHSHPIIAAVITLLVTVVVGNAAAQTKLNLPGESFKLDGYDAFVMLPEQQLRSKPQPWIMYAPTLPAYPDVHERWMHEQFLAAGIAVAGIDAGEAYGSPRGQAAMTTLWEHLTSEREFADRCCLLGRSRGGLWASSWAAAHPNRVAGIAAIYPAFDLRTYPGLDRAASAYQLTPEQLSQQLERHNPIARGRVLAEARIPVFIIHGEIDNVVPIRENSLALRDLYAKHDAGDRFTIEVIADQGHNHWPGFFRCEPLVEFAITQARTGMHQPNE